MADEVEFSKSYAGHFIVSNAMLEDPNFTETVVLMVEHSAEGAFGLTINRRLDLKLKDVVPDEFHQDFAEEQIYSGGPVGSNNLFYIYSPADTTKPPTGESGESMKPIVPNVFLGTSYEPLKEGKKEIEHVLFFLGYAGWGPLQLEYEMMNNSWVTLQANKDIIFDPDPDQTWRRALKSKGGIYSFFARHIGDPGLN